MTKTKKRPTKTEASTGEIIAPLRLRKISIRHFRGLEALDLEIPKPRSPGDGDILVVGSKNGAGKTSLLEACALVMIAPMSGATAHSIHGEFPSYMVRAGHDQAVIRATLEMGGHSYDVTTTVTREIFHIQFDVPDDLGRRLKSIPRSVGVFLEPILRVLLGFSPDPLLTELVGYWHSYRRVAPGNLDLRVLTSGEPWRTRDMRIEDRPRNEFKREVVLALMSKAGLFEGIASRDAEDALEKVNELTRRFAQGTIEKLRPSSESAMDVRISPTHGGESYSFDGLSSGQKEMISTLFLLWRRTQLRPSVILIDEPELHLNAEWHAEVIGSLVEMAPRNQYILATHSEDIAAAVSADRRVIIQASRG